MKTYPLQEIVNVEVLQDVQDQFSHASGMGVIITDKNGIPVTTPTNFTSFCTYIRSTKEGLTYCMLSDKVLGLKAAKKAKPVHHLCHSDLTDLAAPILLHGKHIGTILCGQVLKKGLDRQKVDQVFSKWKNSTINQNLLSLYHKQLKHTDEKQLEATMQTLQLAASYLSELAANYLTQKELNESRQKLLEERHIREQLERLLKETELKALNSQINPHFLFNTLNTISRLAYMENAKQTEDVTYILANIMRYTLRDVTQLVTLREELDYIRDYISIQNRRFDNRIQYEELMDLDATTVRVPILTVQPLIENAVIHGLDAEVGELSIILHGKKVNKGVVLQITDTGTGMNKERLSAILPIGSEERKGHRSGIGMENIHKRMKHYFGEMFGINKIDSKLGAGTTIEILIPNSIQGGL